MGAWGTESFENDDALDWLSDLEESESHSVIETALEQIINAGDDFLEAPDCSMAVAAAAITAALHDHQTDGLPPEASAWVEGKEEPAETLIEAALHALARIQSDSELRDMWAERDELSQWNQTIEDLKERLHV